MDFRGRNIDLVGKQNLWFGISVVLMLIGAVSFGMYGLNLGIDFKGGGQFSYTIPENKRPTSGDASALLEEAREALEKQGVERTKIQVEGGTNLVINTDALPSQLQAQSKLIGTALAGVFDEEPRLVGQQSVGPVIGEELRRNAINGVIFGIFFIALWIYIRYNFAGDGLRYAVAGIAALLHDVFVLIGIFALIGHIDPRIEVDGAFIAALLTVVGYSINDSVVIFDRIRENARLRRKEPYLKIVNDSLLETMSRSINTGMTVIIMLLVLLFLGGESMYNFVLAMLIGIVSGLYSSIFNASMVLVAWHRAGEKKAARLRAARGAASAATATRTPAVRSSTPGASSGSLPAGAATPRQTFASRPAATTSGAVPATAGADATAEDATNATPDNESSPDATQTDDSARQPKPRPAAAPADPSRTYTGPRKARTKRRF